MNERKSSACCANCAHAHLQGDNILCYAKKFAPKVEALWWCVDHKPKHKPNSSWNLTDAVLPDQFVSVQVYIPSQSPFPTVREGYVIDSHVLSGPHWYIPALCETIKLNDVLAWRPFDEPPSDII